LKNTDNEIITSLKKLLSGQNGTIVLVTHENPDGDAIGSAIGLAEVLNNSGRDVKIIVPNDYPFFLKWFRSDLEILIYDHNKRKAKRILADASLLICLDFNDPKRVANMEKKLTQFSMPKVIIDHHPYPVDFADYLISETNYSSTAELVYKIIKEMDFSKYINPAAAEALYTGIMTDTGSFSHNISRPEVFKAVSELMAWDVDTDKIQSAVYHNFSNSRMKLLGYCLNKKMEVLPEYRSAVIYISKKELEEYDFKPGDTEGYVNYPLSIKNIVFSALLIEKKNCIKASFRSKGNFPANLFAQEHFNGGGHVNAAGGESTLSLSETVEMFKQLLKDYEHLLKETII